MTYRQAKKLHNEDEVIIKQTKQSTYVLNTEIHDKVIFIYCTDGETYRHTEVK